MLQFRYVVCKLLKLQAPIIKFFFSLNSNCNRYRWVLIGLRYRTVISYFSLASLIIIQLLVTFQINIATTYNSQLTKKYYYYTYFNFYYQINIEFETELFLLQTTLEKNSFYLNFFHCTKSRKKSYKWARADGF